MNIFSLVFIFIAILLIFLLIYSFIIAVYTQVPLVVTPKKRFDLIFDFLKRNSKKPFSESVFMDLGSGLGQVLFEAERRGFKTVIGYEISHLYVCVAKIKALLKGSKVKTKRNNFLSADLSEADVIYCFLTKKAFNKLSEVIISQTKPGALVCILCDALHGKEPKEIIDAQENGVKIYCYEM